MPRRRSRENDAMFEGVDLKVKGSRGQSQRGKRHAEVHETLGGENDMSDKAQEEVSSTKPKKRLVEESIRKTSIQFQPLPLNKGLAKVKAQSREKMKTQSKNQDKKRSSSRLGKHPSKDRISSKERLRKQMNAQFTSSEVKIILSNTQIAEVLPIRKSSKTTFLKPAIKKPSGEKIESKKSRKDSEKLSVMEESSSQMSSTASPSKQKGIKLKSGEKFFNKPSEKASEKSARKSASKETKRSRKTSELIINKWSKGMMSSRDRAPKDSEMGSTDKSQKSFTGTNSFRTGKTPSARGKEDKDLQNQLKKIDFRAEAIRGSMTKISSKNLLLNKMNSPSNQKQKANNASQKLASKKGGWRNSPEKTSSIIEMMDDVKVRKKATLDRLKGDFGMTQRNQNNVAKKSQNIVDLRSRVESQESLKMSDSQIRIGARGPKSEQQKNKEQEVRKQLSKTRMSSMKSAKSYDSVPYTVSFKTLPVFKKRSKSFARKSRSKDLSSQSSRSGKRSKKRPSIFKESESEGESPEGSEYKEMEQRSRKTKSKYTAKTKPSRSQDSLKASSKKSKSNDGLRSVKSPKSKSQELVKLARSRSRTQTARKNSRAQEYTTSESSSSDESEQRKRNRSSKQRESSRKSVQRIQSRERSRNESRRDSRNESRRSKSREYSKKVATSSSSAAESEVEESSRRSKQPKYSKRHLTSKRRDSEEKDISQKSEREFGEIKSKSRESSKRTMPSKRSETAKATKASKSREAISSRGSGRQGSTKPSKFQQTRSRELMVMLTKSREAIKPPRIRKTKALNKSREMMVMLSQSRETTSANKPTKSREMIKSALPRANKPTVKQIPRSKPYRNVLADSNRKFPSSGKSAQKQEKSEGHTELAVTSSTLLARTPEERELLKAKKQMTNTIIKSSSREYLKTLKSLGQQTPKVDGRAPTKPIVAQASKASEQWKPKARLARIAAKPPKKYGQALPAPPPSSTKSKEFIPPVVLKSPTRNRSREDTVTITPPKSRSKESVIPLIAARSRSKMGLLPAKKPKSREAFELADTRKANQNLPPTPAKPGASRSRESVLTANVKRSKSFDVFVITNKSRSQDSLKTTATKRSKSQELLNLKAAHKILPTPKLGVRS